MLAGFAPLKISATIGAQSRKRSKQAIFPGFILPSLATLALVRHEVRRGSTR